MKCLLITWCDLSFQSFQSVSVMLRCQTAVKTSRNLFSWAVFSMSVLDLYLLCMTLLPWIDKILFSNYKKEHVLFFFVFLLHQTSHISHVFQWNESLYLFLPVMAWELSSDISCAIIFLQLRNVAKIRALLSFANSNCKLRNKVLLSPGLIIAELLLDFGMYPLSLTPLHALIFVLT